MKMVIDSNKRMSESLLWKLQEKAYGTFGPSAWSDKGVPFYITSNPFTAKKYAQVIVGYLRDCLRDNPKISSTEPFYIFDLGVGSGRFAYLFLREFRSLIKALDHQKLNICYVMTDIVTSNLEFCRNHPRLHEFFEEGIVDLAEYHHAQEKPIQLKISQKVLKPETVQNPIILIANYFFDTIPQDLFKVEKGRLFEGRLTLEAEQEAKEPLDPAIIGSLRCSYDYYPIEDIEHYYTLPLLSSILKEYVNQLQNTTFLFPIGGFQSIHYFSNLAQGRLFLIAGDQAVNTLEQIEHWGEPKISKHGSFSISVNYHAISRYFEFNGGRGFLTSDSDPLFAVVAGVLGWSNEHLLETALAFHNDIDAFEPSDYWKLVDNLEKQPLSLGSILLLLKLGNWDPMNFYAFYDKIRQYLPQASAEEKQFLQNAIYNTYERFYALKSEDGLFVLNLGVLLYEMKEFYEAVFYFQRALEITGPTAMCLNNLTACFAAIRKSEANETSIKDDKKGQKRLKG